MQQYSQVNQELKNGEIGDIVAVREAETELISEHAGDLLSSEESIKRIANENANIAVRIYEWLKEAIAKIIKKSYTNSEKYKFLRKAVTKFMLVRALLHF